MTSTFNESTGIRAILLDIEGTTTAVNFVYQTLFPFARQRIKSFLADLYYQADIQVDLEALKVEYALDAPNSPNPVIWENDTPDGHCASALAYIYWLMDRDRKSTVLKALQGKIWEAGYRSGEIKGHIYADVPLALIRWQQQNRRIAIFSSGSVLAQQLLFAHSVAGNLTGYINAYFDTTTGPKREAESYYQIAKNLQYHTAQLLFLSDITAELDAARQAGLTTGLVVRTDPAPTTEHPIIKTFTTVFP